MSLRREEIARAIREHPVVIVAGETGSGKTTQLPKICVLAGRGQTGRIGHTQPRRIAAVTVAQRIAEELSSPPGEHVGYKVRFQDRLQPGATIKLMTDGILLAETQGDPWLREYDTIIVDEAHERSLNIDFLLGYLKGLVGRRSDFRLIITSATIDAQRFAEHFGMPGRPAPVIELSGRLFPVEIRWRAPQAIAAQRRQSAPGGLKTGAAAAVRTGADEEPVDLPESIGHAIDEVWRERPGDVLVFLPGEREIREVETYLRRHPPGPPAQREAMEVLPLFSRLAAGDQMKVFGAGASTGRRIVLATNVAETSVTVPGIRYVIDPGQARVKRYRYRGKVEQLQIEPVSRASANQRAGRCGRVADGVCVRLYDAEDFERRPAFTDPEILRSSLASVILRMMALGLADGVDAVEAFPFLDSPPRRAIVDGQALLLELGALDEAGRLTEMGRTIARLPLDPRIARMLLAARAMGALREVLIVASALSVQDPRERPAEAAQAADEAQKQFADERSDFVAWIKLWDWIRSLSNEPAVQSAHPNPQAGPAAGGRLSQRKREQLLRAKFLNPRRVREWMDIHQQLQSAVADLGWQENSAPASYQALHEALLAGLLGNVGNKASEEAHYQGTHAVRFWPHPSTGIKKGAKWLMAAELVDTTRLYARGLARIEPEWVERIGAHLIRKQWSEPHWEKKAGQAMAAERATLYGLIIYAGRRVPFGQRDPKLARELLIREGLVAGDWDSRLPFILHNQRLVAEIEQLEHRMRRPDLLVDEHRLFSYYDARIPPSVVSGQGLEHWWREASRADPQILHLSRDFLLRREAGEAADEAADDQRFPRTLAMRGAHFSLSYLFEPGNPRDGVTLSVPLAMLAQVDSVRVDWLVPGLLRDKVLALLKSLPPRIRHRCQPLVETADAFLQTLPMEGLAPDMALIDALAELVRERTGLRPRADDFRLETLPAHLLMNYALVDPHGRELGVGRSLAQLRADHGRDAQSALREAFAAASKKATQGQPALQTKAEAEASPAHGKHAELAPAPGTSSGTARSMVRAAVEPAPAVPLAESDLALAGSEPQTSWTFGSLPELLELRRQGQTLIGFPGLVDRGGGVTIELFDDPEVAHRTHCGGVARLASIALREPLKALERALPDLPRLAMAWMPFGSADELRAELQAGALARTVLSEAPPMDADTFERRVIDARPRISLIGQAFAREVAAILHEHQALLRKLPSVKSNPAVAADLERQLADLLPRRWPTVTPSDRLGHLARYLKAIGLRLDKLRADPARDTMKSAEILPLLQNLRRAQAARRGVADARLEEYRWLLEELRVSLYAQELRAAVPVSVKRLQKIWESIGT